MGSWKVLTWKARNEIENNELGKVQPKVILSNFSQTLLLNGICQIWIRCVQLRNFGTESDFGASKNSIKL